MQIVAAILRFVQIVFAAIVLGLSVSLAKGQAPKDNYLDVDSNVPATTSYTAFTGGFGMLVAVIGIVALFVELLQGIIMLVLDGLAGVLFLAGGVAVAVGLRGTSCSSLVDTYKNHLLNGGCKHAKEGLECWVNTRDKLSNRCKMDEADSAFMFLGFIICAGLVAHTFWFGGRMAGRKNIV